MPVLKRIAVLYDLGQLSFSRQQLRVTRQNRADEQWGLNNSEVENVFLLKFRTVKSFIYRIMIKIYKKHLVNIFSIFFFF
jgi:hypothetical protein